MYTYEDSGGETKQKATFSRLHASVTRNVRTDRMHDGYVLYSGGGVAAGDLCRLLSTIHGGIE